MTVYEIWIEGYAVTGQQGKARLLGRAEGATFSEAVKSLAEKNKWGEDFDPSRLSYWGCQLFDNARDARRSFG